MKRGVQRRYETRGTRHEPFSAFIPKALPPDPPLRLEGLQDLAEGANRALGRLDGISALLPDPSLFLYLYVRKEAILSSQIEGTQSSFSELLLYEGDLAAGLRFDDVKEVSRYVAAMSHGLSRMREGFPLSLRLLREIHAILMAEGRGSEQNRGEFRTSQNWIGGTRPGNAAFVPPPEGLVLELMGQMEAFLHDQPRRTPTLIKAALSHVQFETIHPFLDGNGRLGRLLITFLLCAEGAISEPLLYLSLYFKQHRERYYELLQGVRIQGNWEEWLEFFLDGVRTTAEQASGTARRILTLLESDRTRLEQIGRGAGSALRVHYAMRRKPLLSIPQASRELGLSAPTIAAALDTMEKFGIVQEVTGRARDRLFVYGSYLAILNEGTEVEGAGPFL